MRKSRLILGCIIVFALAGTRVARAQDGTASLDDQIQNKYSERESDKAKATHEEDKAKTKNNDGHPKHWWSLPHFHHKKESKNAAPPQRQSNMKSKTVAAKPTNKASFQQASGHKAAGGRSGHAAIATKRNAHNSVASATPHQKSVATRSKASKPLSRDCSAAKAKSGGCQSVQKRAARTSTSRS